MAERYDDDARRRRDEDERREGSAEQRRQWPHDDSRTDPNWGAGGGRPFTQRGDRDAYDRFQTGYFDSSMGYPAGEYGGGSLNPFTYRGPGSSYAGRGPKNYQRTDERIREDVVARLTDDHRVDATDVDVQVVNGEVTLSGHVLDRRMRRAAEECVEDLPGVRDVHNQLGLTPSVTASAGDSADRDRNR